MRTNARSANPGMERLSALLGFRVVKSARDGIVGSSGTQAAAKRSVVENSSASWRTSKKGFPKTVLRPMPVDRSLSDRLSDQPSATA